MPRPAAYWMVPAALALALFAVTVPGTYTYDDVYSCKEDPRLHDTGQWGKFLREGYFPDGADNLWRPLVSYSYALEVKLHGDRAWVFHLINVLLHATAAALVAALGARLAGRKVGLLAGLLFAVHPVHVEAVAGIVGRAEEMAAIGILAALLLFIDRPMTPRRAVAIVGCFLFATFSKEQGLLIPPMLLAWTLVRRWRLAAHSSAPAGQHPVLPLDYAGPIAKAALTPEQSASRLLLGLLTVVMAAYIAYRNHILPWFWERGFLDPAFNPLALSKGLDRWLIPVAILGRYTELLLVPTHFSLDYGMSVFTPRLDLHEPYFAVGILAVLTWAAAGLFFYRTRRAPQLFALISLALSYLLISNLFIIGTIMGERLAYLPSTFVCILIATALMKLRRRAMIGVATALIALAAVRTETYAYQWNTRPRLYRYAHNAQPKAAMPYLLLAGEVDTKEADALLARARIECPEASQVWGKSAWCKIALGQMDEAYEFALQSFHLRPGNTDAMGAFVTIQVKRAATRPASRPGG